MRMRLKETVSVRRARQEGIKGRDHRLQHGHFKTSETEQLLVMLRPEGEPRGSQDQRGGRPGGAGRRTASVAGGSSHGTEGAVAWARREGRFPEAPASAHRQAPAFPRPGPPGPPCRDAWAQVLEEQGWGAVAYKGKSIPGDTKPGGPTSLRETKLFGSKSTGE